MSERLRTLPWDWYAGTIPDNVVIDATAYVETAFSFALAHSRRPESVRMGRGASAYLGTMFDVGPGGQVIVGDYTLLNGVRLICDAQISIGAYCLFSWNVVVMDTYRLPIDPDARRRAIASRRALDTDFVADASAARAVSVGANVWVGFDVCILPGVTIGDGAIVGAKSVVSSNVPPYSVAAGNPARVIRTIAEPKKAR